MSQIEIEIKVLEGQLDIINQTIASIGTVPANLQQKKEMCKWVIF